MGVSKNNGTPKSSILIGFSLIFTIHFGCFPPCFWFNAHIEIANWIWRSPPSGCQPWNLSLGALVRHRSAWKSRESEDNIAKVPQPNCPTLEKRRGFINKASTGKINWEKWAPNNKNNRTKSTWKSISRFFFCLWERKKIDLDWKGVVECPSVLAGFNLN